MGTERQFNYEEEWSKLFNQFQEKNNCQKGLLLEDFQRLISGQYKTRKMTDGSDVIIWGRGGQKGWGMKKSEMSTKRDPCKFKTVKAQAALAQQSAKKRGRPLAQAISRFPKSELFHPVTRRSAFIASQKNQGHMADADSHTGNVS